METAKLAGTAEAATAITTMAALTAAYPQLCGAVRAEGATAERDRLVGIEALGAQMKGHEALIAAMKADGSVTVEQAAVRLVGAENALREGQLKGIKDVENHTGKVAAAPQASAGAGAEPPKSGATTPEGWATEYAAETPAGVALRAEFPTKETYVAFKTNESKVRIFTPGAR